MSGQNNKKLKTTDIIMDCIIAGVVLVLVIVIATTFLNKKDSSNSTDNEKQVSASATPKVEEKEAGVTRYVCTISSDASNETLFDVSFDSNAMTFTETLQAANQSTELDKGTYIEKNGQLITTSSKTKKELVYEKDGDYLIVANKMFAGKVPDKETFDATFTYEEKNQNKTTIHFKEDGSYEQTILSYAKKGSSQKDSKETTQGTYKRNGKFIQRTSEKKEPLLDFYIYKDKLSNAYYKLEK